SRKESLSTAVGELPRFMRSFNTTAVNLRSALDDVDPLVDAAKPVAPGRPLPPPLPPRPARRVDPARADGPRPRPGGASRRQGQRPGRVPPPPGTAVTHPPPAASNDAPHSETHS